ncbi:glycosyltransferase family 4 protein [Cellulosimicrobium sp. ES-005]|uniref:D-inositol 3-phosphate glycosyltransferase n=1 Tax=Cellulosimicrobium sp. ES-005 TaxID=3163031 RepID=A0AAU8G3T0_9MICO
MTSRRPRVVLATRIYSPEPAAASFRLRALARALVESGAAVTVLTTTAPQAPAPEDPDPGVRIRRWPVLRDRTGYVRGYLQYLSFDVPLLLRLLFSTRPDVVVVEPPPTTGFVARLACVVRRVPYVYYAADVWSDAANSTGAPAPVVAAVRRVEGWVLRGARRVVAVTEEVAERTRALGARETVVVRNGIDTDVFRPDGPVPDGAPAGPYAIYAGTTSEWQGADVFVRAMATVAEAVPGATLVVLGQGSAWADLEAVARALPDGGACVRMLRPVPQAEAAAWLRGAAVALVSLRPGQGYDFAFPTKVLAGAASGTPVLYAGPGPARGVIEENGLGRAVAHDVDAVAEAMSDLLEAPADDGPRTRSAGWARTHASIAASAAEVARIAVAASRVPDHRLTAPTLGGVRPSPGLTEEHDA